MQQADPSPFDPLICRTAKCDCGSLTIVAQGEPLHVHACTCTLCQRSSGSVMSLSAWFPVDRVTITGQVTRFHHRGEGNPDRYRCFCPVCGTGRFFRSGPAFPDTIGVCVGGFADPLFPAPEFILYWTNRPYWLVPPDTVAIYPNGDDDI